MLNIQYDKVTDVLEVMTCKPYPTVNYMIDLNYTLRLDPKTRKLVGLTVVCYEEIFPSNQTRNERRMVGAILLAVFHQLWYEGVFASPTSKKAA